MIVEPLAGKALLAATQSAFMVGLEGSVRSGKTWASLLDWLRFCREGPKGTLVMAGRTERTVIENVVLPLQGFLGEHRVKLNRGLGTVWILGRRVRIVGANDEQAQTKIQGPTFAGAYVDEASTVPESFFNMLFSRLSVEGARMWFTSNPESPAHWLKVNWLDRARLWIDQDGNRHENPDGVDLVRVSFKLEDNPNLPPPYVERVKGAYSGLWYRRYILGEWCIAAGAIYEDWDPVRHVIAAGNLPPIARVLSAGIDYGTTHRTRGYLLGISAEPRPRLVVLDEWRPERSTDAGFSADYRRWIAKRPLEWRSPEWIAVSPDAASFRLQLFEDGLANVMCASNAVVNGLRTVASLLTADRLVVSDTCEELVKEIPGYVWDPKATARGEDAPLKENDDCVDALRYAVASTRALWGLQIPITIPLTSEEAAA